MKKMITGNRAAALGSKLARAQVVAAYPITPQTKIVESIAEMVARGEMKCKYIMVESEHSAMSACISASATGVRTFTATAAHGLALMHEVLHWAAGQRLPITMVNINRALGPPWSVWVEHTDSMSQRDTGWMQVYCESNQEVLDSVIMAYKVGERADVLLPTMICADAFYLSHTSEPVDIPEQKKVDDFLPPYKPKYKLDVDDPHGFGSLSMPHQWYMELRYQMAEAMEHAKKHIPEVEREFAEVFGRRYRAIEPYRCEDVDYVLMGMGTMADTAREAIDRLRSRGEKVGFVRLRTFRPFPVKELRALARGIDRLGVIDRSFTFGYEGPLFTEVKGALYGTPQPPEIRGYVAGLGGRDITVETIEDIYRRLSKKKWKGEEEWIGLKMEKR